MKVIFAIFLSLQIVSHDAFVEEVLKMRGLTDHFKEHLKENPQLNFFVFLKMHYADAQHQKDDAARHHSLPLKTINHTLFECFSFDDAMGIETSTSPLFVYLSLLKSFYKSCFFENRTTVGIFQPPRY